MKFGATFGRGVTVVLATLGRSHAQRQPVPISDACLTAGAVLGDSSDFTQASILLGTSVPEIPQASDPIQVNTVHDWGNAQSLSRYDRMRDECEAAGTGYRMCTVNTRTKFTQELGDQAGINYVDERAKPVCFPPTCRADVTDAAVLEPEPARCEPASDLRPCEILAYENVVCPTDRPAVADGSVCQQTLSQSSPFFFQRALIESRVRGACPQNAAVAGSSDLCSVEVLPVQISSIRDYTAKNSNEYYKDFVDTCLSLDGKICETTMTTQQKTVREGLGEVQFRRTYLDLPVCMSQQCNSDDEAKMVRKRFVDTLSGVPCDLEDLSCTVDINKLDCGGYTPKPTTQRDVTPPPTAAPTQEILTPQCRKADDELTPELLASAAILTASYPDVPEPATPISVTTVQHWDKITDNNIQQRMEDNCKQNTDHTICTVNTVVEFSQELGGQAATNRIEERNKPVCMPPACADADIAVIEAQPGRCNPDRLPCEIISYDVTCPADRPVTAGATCAQTLDTLTDPFFLSRSLLESRIQTSCLSGGSGRFCDVTADNVMLSSSLDYTGYETNDAYLTYEETCLSNQGQVCHVDLQVLQESPLDLVEEIDVTVTAFRDYTLFPVCVARSCESNDDVTAVIQSRVPACDLESGSCLLEILTQDCDGFAPTRSPAPTPAPTVDPISETCREGDAAVVRDTAAQALLLAANYPDVPETNEAVDVVTVRRWDEAVDDRLYERLVDECAAKTDHTLCTMNTAVVFATELAGQNASNTVIETDKPVCVPPTCAETDVALIEAAPGRCNDDGVLSDANITLPCTVERFDMTCPADRVVSGTCNNNNTADNNVDFFQATRALLEGKILTQCGTGRGTYCEVDTEDVVVKSTRDHAGYETDEVYQDYLAKCLEGDQGRMCLVDMKVTQEAGERATDVVGLEVTLERTLTDFPICVSTDCGSGSDLREVQAIIKARVPACDIGAACEVELYKMQCVDKEDVPDTTPNPVNSPPSTPSPVTPTGDGGSGGTTPTTSAPTKSPVVSEPTGGTTDNLGQVTTTSGGTSPYASTRGNAAVVASAVFAMLTLTL